MVPAHRYSQDQTQLALDLCLFINGLPVAAFELKNKLTKQTVADAINQYKVDRNIQDLLFQFGRCLVHFAVDDHEVWMCTELKGKESWFLQASLPEIGCAASADGAIGDVAVWPSGDWTSRASTQRNPYPRNAAFRNLASLLTGGACHGPVAGVRVTTKRGDQGLWAFDTSGVS